MISYKDFEDKNGEVNWNAYRNAQKDAGEICNTCESIMMLLINGKKYRRDCTKCENLKNKSEEVEHNKYIRCPNCGDFFAPSECDEYGVFEDGSHSLQCQECNYEFEITTNVSYSFESPERIKNE